MAPELRKRKVASDSQKSQRPAPKAPEKASKVKRKAADQASPVSSKKQKATKPTSAREKAADKTDKVEKAEKPSNRGKEEEDISHSTVKPKKPSKADKTSKARKPAKTETATEAVSADPAPAPEEQEGDDGVLLLAEELDSGEEDTTTETAPFEPGQDVGKIPTISKDVLKAAKASTGERGVIYIGRIPHGFYEHEMRQYLSQFGPVSRVRLSRNKKTGASKHFAFVEFQDESTAEIVTKTMDNYLLFGHILKVKMLSKDQVHEELFKGANRRFKKVPWNKMAGKKLERPKSQSAWEVKVETERANRAQRAEKLKAIGYEFEAPDLKDVPDVLPAAALDKSKEAEAEAVEAAADGPEAKGTPALAAAEAPEPDVETTPAAKAKAAKKKGARSGRAQKAKA